MRARIESASTCAGDACRGVDRPASSWGCARDTNISIDKCSVSSDHWLYTLMPPARLNPCYIGIGGWVGLNSTSQRQFSTKCWNVDLPLTYELTLSRRNA